MSRTGGTKKSNLAGGGENSVFVFFFLGNKVRVFSFLFAQHIFSWNSSSVLWKVYGWQHPRLVLGGGLVRKLQLSVAVHGENLLKLVYFGNSTHALKSIFSAPWSCRCTARRSPGISRRASQRGIWWAKKMMFVKTLFFFCFPVFPTCAPSGPIRRLVSAGGSLPPRPVCRRIRWPQTGKTTTNNPKFVLTNVEQKAKSAFFLACPLWVM